MIENNLTAETQSAQRENDYKKTHLKDARLQGCRR
jgi:hypothetical protein